MTREVASKFMDKVRETGCYEVEVDFSGIDFISRSFADQFHKEKIELWESGKKNVIVTNAHDDVFSMFQAICKTQKEVNRNYESYPVIHFQTRRSLENYLHSM